MSELDVSNLLTVQQAIEIIDAVAVTPGVIRVPLAEAQGLHLAEDLKSDRDYPPFDKSLMDGYAVRAADVAAAPMKLRLVGEVAAGGQSSRTLAVGETMAIMTGAPIPPGADGVVPIEDTAREGDVIRIVRAEKSSRFIARQGADIRQGEIVLRRGTKFEAAQLAVAATIGAYQIAVHPRVRVAVLSTGDEIIPIDAMPTGAQIRNSNSLMLAALLKRFGCDVTDLGIARDDPDIIRRAIVQGQTYDALFITGGMSMGAYDYVPGLLRQLGYDLRITKLRIKPGKPFVFGAGNGQSKGTGAFIFGLPGNPVSGFACTVRLASRLLVRLAGGSPVERWLVARLTTPLPANGPREFYQPARLSWCAEGPLVAPLPWKGSADLFTLAGADALLVRPENDGQQPIGALVRILEI
jgi:molybdopterin molybdotransferase